MGANGRCAERGFLEYHHVEPYAAGGLTTIQNLELRCRSHNAYEAEQYFGPLLIRETRALWGGLTRSGPDRERENASRFRTITCPHPRSKTLLSIEG